MRHAKLRVLLASAGVAAVVVAGCGNPSPELTFTSATPAGPDVGTSSSPLLGNWVQTHIGNCINDEAWLGFDAPDVLTVTSVDRNFCYGHKVAASTGSWCVVDGDELELSWTTPDGNAHSARATHAIRSGGAEFGTELPQGYVVGDRSLVMGALLRGSAPNAFHLEDSESSVEDGKTYRIARTADVALDVDPATVTLPAACTMNVTLTVDTAWGDLAPEKATESFALPCHVAAIDGTTARVTADGYENSATDSFWSNLFTARGIWSAHSGFVSNELYELFRPILTVERGDGGEAELNRPRSTYARMESSPPSSIE